MWHLPHTGCRAGGGHCCCCYKPVQIPEGHMRSLRTATQMPPLQSGSRLTSRQRPDLAFNIKTTPRHGLQGGDRHGSCAKVRWRKRQHGQSRIDGQKGKLGRPGMEKTFTRSSTSAQQESLNRNSHRPQHAWLEQTQGSSALPRDVQASKEKQAFFRIKHSRIWHRMVARSNESGWK